MSSLPFALFTAAQVRELDRVAIEESGIPGETLMERAGQAAFELIQQLAPDAGRIVVMCGTGNNGGDGFIVARLAREAGLEVSVYQVGDGTRLKGDALTAADKLKTAGISPVPFTKKSGINECDVLIDAMLGTGLNGKVQEPWREAIKAVNKNPAPVIALDIPSGLNADTGRIMEVAIKAQATISFIGLKQGLFTADGLDCSTQVFYHGLQVPADVIMRIMPSATRLQLAPLRHLLSTRRRNTHKGSYGHVLIIGGDYGMSGAAQLAAESAMRAGAGMVTVATRPDHVPVITSTCPEVLCYGINNSADLRPLLKKADVIAIGPGLGQSEWAQLLLGAALETKLPLVVDADALNLIAKEPIQRTNWILTPHPGEAGRLLNKPTAEIQTDRFTAVRNITQQYGGVCVLKGAGTLVSGGDEPVGVCAEGNPGMATAGMGDVLTGIIAGLLAQKPAVDNPQLAVARLGVCVHALAGDRAALAGERGMMARDVIKGLRQIVNT